MSDKPHTREAATHPATRTIQTGLLLWGRRRRAARVLILGCLGGWLWAGPPFKTDDPQPVDLGHMELYLFSTGQHLPGGNTGIGPAMEFNLGILPDTQFHVIVPYAYTQAPASPAQHGLGDIEIGIKFRILHESRTLPQIGIFPLVEIPTGNTQKGLGAGQTQIYLPVWIQKSWGAWTTYGGLGWWRNPGTLNRNWSFAGWLIQRDFGEPLTLGLEAFRTTAMRLGGQTSSGFNVGGQINLSEQHHVLFSAGRNVSGDTQSFFYVGYQFTAGAFKNLGDWLQERRRHA